jgi:hypothetical protein
MINPSSLEPAVSPLRFQCIEACRFLARLTLILLPVLVCYALLEAIAWRVGQTWSMQHVAQWQGDDPTRTYRGGDPHYIAPYKMARVRQRKPDVIMLGSSRSNYVRAEMFKPYSFQNCSLTAWTFNQYLRFLQTISSDGYAPKALFFNLDYWMFNDEYNRAWDDLFSEPPPTHWQELKTVIDELLREPANFLSRVFRAENAKGVYALRFGLGFQVDGSLAVSGTPDANPARLMGDYHVGAVPFVFGDRFNPEQMNSFERFVDFAKSKNIALIGIQFPFYAGILDALDRTSQGLWHQFNSDNSRSYIESKGVVFFDFANMPEYRDKPEAFMNSGHAASDVIEDVMNRVLEDSRVSTLLPQLKASR